MPKVKEPDVLRKCEYCGKEFYIPAYRVRAGEGKHCSLRCNGKTNNWKGGRRIRHGYIFLTLPDGTRIKEHRYVMEQFIGRKLNRSEIVHHINGNRLDNRIENLQIMTASQHMKIHQTGKTIGKWAKKYDRCIECGKTEYKHQGKGLCKHCYLSKYRRTYVRER